METWQDGTHSVLPALLRGVVSGEKQNEAVTRDIFGDLSYALGGYSAARRGGRSDDGSLEKWDPDVKAVRAMIAAN